MLQMKVTVSVYKFSIKYSHKKCHKPIYGLTKDNVMGESAAVNI